MNNQTDHILAQGSIDIPDGSDSVTILVPGFKRTAPSLVLTPMGENANVNLYIDDASTAYSSISYDLTKAFETKNGGYKYSAPAEIWDEASSNSYPEGGLQAWWRLNEDMADTSPTGTAWDSGPNARQGTQTTSADRPAFSSTLFPSRYVQDTGSCTFDGTDSHIDLGLGSIWDTLIGNGTDSPRTLTFSAWVYLTSGYSDIRTILSFGGADVWWYVQQQTPTFYTKWQGGTHAAVWRPAIGTWVPYETWTHLAMSYDANDPANFPSIYVNGTACTGVVNTAFTPIEPWYGIAGGGFLGSYSSSPGAAWVGQLADVAVWNRILTAEDIRAIYDVGIAGVVDNTFKGWPFTIKRSSDVGTTTVQWQAIGADPTRIK